MHYRAMRPSLRNANVKWFSDKPIPGSKRARRHASPRQIVVLRLHDLARLFRARYGRSELPDDDSGRDDIEPVIHHLAALTHPARRAAQWLELWAPWLTIAEQRRIIADGITGARPWTADQLAWRYHVTKEQRAMLGLTTIGAIDQGKAARTKRRRERDRQRKAAARRAKGIKPRREYEKAALERAKPWAAEGISRRTWYRRRTCANTPPSDTGTGPATA
jgi:hypothetical protein